MIKKYKYQKIVIVLGFTISLIMLFYMSNNYLYFQSIKDDEKNYSLNYSKEVMCSIVSNDQMKKLLNLNIENVKLSVKSVFLFIDEFGVTNTEAEILICNNTDFKYPVIYEYSGNNGVFLGRKYKRILKSKDSILIGGDLYKINSYISSNKSSLYDNSVIINSKDVGKNTIERLLLQKENIDIYIESDIVSEEEMVSRIYSILEENGIEILYENEKEEEHEGYYYDDTTFLIILIYSFLMIFIVMIFWTNSRMYEFAIRRTFGENSFHIIGTVLWEMSRLFFTSCIIAATLIIVVSLVTDEYIKYNDYLMMILMVWILDFIINMVFIIIVPIFELIKLNPAELIVRHKEI